MEVAKLQKLANQLLAEEETAQEEVKRRRREYRQRRKKEREKIKQEMTPEQRQYVEALEFAVKIWPKELPKYWTEKRFNYARGLARIIINRTEALMKLEPRIENFMEDGYETDH